MARRSSNQGRSSVSIVHRKETELELLVATPNIAAREAGVKTGQRYPERLRHAAGLKRAQTHRPTNSPWRPATATA
jgi:hypothetical protein